MGGDFKQQKKLWNRIEKLRACKAESGNATSERDDEKHVEDSSDPPDQFLCPISRSLMKDPVVACDGHTYERASIEEWFSSRLLGAVSSPMTNERLANRNLVPNRTVKQLIAQWRGKHAG